MKFNREKVHTTTLCKIQNVVYMYAANAKSKLKVVVNPASTIKEIQDTMLY